MSVARLPKFQVKNTDKGWRVNVPASLSDTEKPQRRFFRTREAANTFAQKLRGEFKAHGEGATQLPPRVEGDAFEAWKILDPLGISLTEAARRVAAIEREIAGSIEITKACAQFEASRDSMSDSQRTAYRLTIKYLTADFSDRLISSISGEELQEHADTRTGGPGAYNQKLRLLRTIWRWSAKPPRKWCSVEPVEHLERRETISKAIEVLNAERAEAVLRSAEKHYPDAVPAFAVALFTGIRKQEMERLGREDFTTEGISIPASKSKTKRRRFIQMTEPVMAWLKRYPVGETLIPTSWDRKERAVRRLAGYRVWTDLIKDEKGNPIPPPINLPEWPDNALRHTAATVALALGKPIETLVFEHGHSGGLTTLQRHYIGVMPKAEAEKIWALRPSL